jgi:hypothetical protein
MVLQCGWWITTPKIKMAFNTVLTVLAWEITPDDGQMRLKHVVRKEGRTYI